MKQPIRSSFLSFSKPVFEAEEINAVADVLRSGWITTGARTAEFERMFGKYVGCHHALGLSSCTAALFLALKILGVKDGDEVILPPLTFAATANVVVHCGAKPVFVDVDASTGLIDPSAFEQAITDRTRAVIPVHLYGRPVASRIHEIARSRGIAVVADCAHATETRVNGIHVARDADIAAFSFYATKNVAVGEGGMLVTDSEEIFRRAEILALHGMSQYAYKRFTESGVKTYDILEAGYKFNMSDINAALGIGQLERIEKHLRRRNEVWRQYDDAFKDLPLALPAAAAEGVTHARHLYTLRASSAAHGNDRNDLLAKIDSCRIGTAIHFEALHLHSFYRDTFGYKRGAFPAAEAISDTTFSIPLTPYLSEEDVADVIAAVRWAAAEG